MSTTYQLDETALAILRSAMDVAFGDQTDEEIAELGFIAGRVREVEAMIANAFVLAATTDDNPIILT